MKLNEIKIHKNSNSLILGGAIIIGLFFLGYLLKRGIENFKAAERVVSVKGLAEKEYPANRVIWPIMFKEAGNDLPNLYSIIERKNQEIISFLKSNGVSDSEMTLNTPEVVDMEADRYASQTNRVFRYSITSVLTVYSERVDNIRKIMNRQSELIKKGIPLSGGDYRYNVQFMFTKLNNIKPGMIEEATKNARSSAEKFAKDSDSKLGKIKSASQGQFTITDRDANTPHIKTVRVVTTLEYYLKD